MNENAETAILIEALVAREDPITRFIQSLPDDERAGGILPSLRKYAEETIQLRNEFMSNVTRCLSCSDPREAAGYAEAISKNVFEMAYRWTMLKKSVQRWSELDTEGLRFKVELGGK